MRGLVTSLAITSVLLGAFTMPAQASTLRFKNESAAYVYINLIWGLSPYQSGFCIHPYSNFTDPVEDNPSVIRARFYAGPKTGPSCSGSLLYNSEYHDVWRKDIEFWATGNDEASYRFYHN